MGSCSFGSRRYFGTTLSESRRLFVNITLSVIQSIAPTVAHVYVPPAGRTGASRAARTCGAGLFKDSRWLS